MGFVWRVVKNIAVIFKIMFAPAFQIALYLLAVGFASAEPECFHIEGRVECQGKGVPTGATLRLMDEDTFDSEDMYAEFGYGEWDKGKPKQKLKAGEKNFQVSGCANDGMQVRDIE